MGFLRVFLGFLKTGFQGFLMGFWDKNEELQSWDRNGRSPKTPKDTQRQSKSRQQEPRTTVCLFFGKHNGLTTVCLLEFLETAHFCVQLLQSNTSKAGHIIPALELLIAASEKCASDLPTRATEKKNRCCDAKIENQVCIFGQNSYARNPHFF